MLRRTVAALVPDRRVTVVVPFDGPLRRQLGEDGATVHVVDDFALRRRYLAPTQLPGLAWRNLATVAHLARRHRRDPVDLVVTNTAAVVAGGALARAIRRPHVWHVHEIVDDPPAFARVMGRLLDRMSDRVVACSDAARDQLVALRPTLADRIDVVRNALPLPDQPAPPGGGDVVRVGCIGRISPRKGQRELVDAWIVAALDDPRLELHLFGDALDGHADLVADLHGRLAGAGLEDRARFHGFVADHDDVYRSLDVVVVPSVQPESFSLVCAEAAAYGLPVIAPAHGGPTEVVVDGETGLLVDPADPAAMAAALRALAGDRRRRLTLGAAGRARAEAAFSLPRYQDGMRAVVDAQLGSAAAGVGR
jgi:glycosyltransferase involved in cell wall biosynthesis